MKFDVVIGNPPYQMSDGGGTGDSAKPVYNDFFSSAKEMSPSYITLVIPARWMKGGKGLSVFREEMIMDTRLKVIHDYQDSKIIFPGVDIDGGVCHFVWEQNHDAPLKYSYRDLHGDTTVSIRYLETGITANVIRDVRHYEIIRKTLTKEGNGSFDEIVSFQNPFGIRSSLFNSPEKHLDVEVIDTYKEGFSLIYGVIGNKGGAKRTSKYVNNEAITRNADSVKKFKLFFSKAFGTKYTVPPKIIKSLPGTLCTETFLKIGDFEEELEMINCLKYIHSKFFRALLFFYRHSLNISKSSFELIPLQDFTSYSDIDWTQSISNIDKQLYLSYGFTEKEILYIEKNIKEMPWNEIE